MKQNFSNQISSFDAKTHLSNLLQRVVKRGEKFTILKHNFPIAILAPIQSQQISEISEVIKNLAAFRKEKKLAGLKLKDLINEGRR
jgi:antitoxin (DNA-binding transcriptional repressor) of toxin-antitoxin stability system